MNIPIEIESPLEKEQRNSTICIGCGYSKQSNTLLCWQCYKYCDLPFKDFNGTLEEWLEIIRLANPK